MDVQLEQLATGHVGAGGGTVGSRHCLPSGLRTKFRSHNVQTVTVVRVEQDLHPVMVQGTIVGYGVHKPAGSTMYPTLQVAQAVGVAQVIQLAIPQVVTTFVLLMQVPSD